MGLPIVGAIAGAVALFFKEEIKAEAKDIARQVGKEVGEKVGKIAAAYALEKMGIPIDLDGDVSRESITQVINEHVLGGQLQFTNLFDREAVKADIKRMALEHAAQNLGYDGGAGIQGIFDGVVTELIRDMRADLVAGQGDFIGAARDLPEALREIAIKKDENANTPVDFTAAGISNRERQARYRAGKTKVWVTR